MKLGIIADTHDDLEDIEKAVRVLYEDPHDFELARKKLIVTHKPKIVEALAVSGAYDVVIYGHTHKAEIEKKENKALMINPGECCGRSHEKENGCHTRFREG
uniref:Calcineurin-like phosphoesterase domain-containing protein n=1 Tax=Candidatus Methanophaga sp. ANME-1 ERB7 TaxID=2759913 RepID=A0A7G9Z524_9EURY|nr:hypothetical protein LFMFKLDH_00012 [Methanosarcinales archaeon ANME-1 ERB7]